MTANSSDNFKLIWRYQCSRSTLNLIIIIIRLPSSKKYNSMMRGKILTHPFSLGFRGFIENRVFSESRVFQNHAFFSESRVFQNHVFSKIACFPKSRVFQNHVFSKITCFPESRVFRIRETMKPMT